MPYPQTNVTAFDGINVPTRADPANWNERGEAAWASLKPGCDQMNVLAGQVNAMADAAQASASAADQDRIDAQQARTDAQAARGTAEGARDTAILAKNAAEAARDKAAGYVDALKASSTTSLVIGVGSKVFSGAGLALKGFGLNQTLKAVNPANAAQWMVGTLSAYVDNGAASSLTLAVSRVSPTAGGNTVANWSITISGEDGPQGMPGGVNGGPLDGALWEKKGNDVPSASVPDVWSAGGNFVPMIGTTAITGLTAAPQAGAQVTLLATSALPITASANLKIKGLATGSSYTCAPGDELDVRAETTTLFHVTIRKADGTPTSHQLGALHNLRVFSASGIFTATKTGFHKITVIGASGSGGAASSAFGGVAAASGAGAGGLVSGMRYLVAGVSYVVTVGAGGVAVNATGAAVNGNPGQATQFGGAGIVSMVANGGEGGKASVSINATLDGGAGGTGSGAPSDQIVQGGSGGVASIAAKAQSIAASGGGAVGLRGTPFNGGAATVGANGALAAGGGAGVGGNGGAAVSSTATNVTAAGGGAGGAAAPAVNTNAATNDQGANYRGVPGGAAGTARDNDLDNATGGGAIGVASITNAGGGSGGATSSSGYAAGMFAGSGGVVNASSQGANAGTTGLFGGAPGGIAGVSASNVNAGPFTSAGVSGSPGGVWIEF